MPRRLVRGKMNKGRIRLSEASRAGVHYVAANNGKIKNEGKVIFKFRRKVDVLPGGRSEQGFSGSLGIGRLQPPSSV